MNERRAKLFYATVEEQQRDEIFCKELKISAIKKKQKSSDTSTICALLAIENSREKVRWWASQLWKRVMWWRESSCPAYSLSVTCVFVCERVDCTTGGEYVISVIDDSLWRYRPSSPGKLPLARTPPRAASRWTPRAPEVAGLRPPLTGPRVWGPPIRPRGTTPRPRPAWPNNTHPNCYPIYS